MTRRWPSRLLVVGWDAADAETVDELLAEGRLPTLASLLDGGCRTDVTGWPGLGDDAIWTTFATGLHPGEHGQFHYVERAPGGFHLVRSEHRTEPFWARLADEGITVSVLDVPKSPVGRRPGTREIHDWMPHGPNSSDPTVWPADVGGAAARPYGEFAECNQQGKARAVADFHLAAIDARRRRRTEVLLDWLDDGPGGRPSDVTIVVYAAAHCTGHNFWYLHEPQTGEDRADRDRLGDALVEQLEAMDADLATAIDRLGPDGAVAVFSASGMQPTISAEEATAELVVELDRVWRRRRPRARAQTSVIRFARRLRRRERRHHLEHAFAPMDYLAGAASAVRLNVIGRDRWGVVPAGERREVLEWLRDDLMAAVDAEGRSVFADVYLTEDRFPGPYSDAHSDLIIVWGLDQPASIRTPSVSLHGLVSPPARPGDHRDGGWLVSPAELAPPPDVVRLDGLADVITGWARDLHDRPTSAAV